MLAETRGLRNKFLHCDLHVAQERLGKMGTKLIDGLVTMVNIETGEAKALVQSDPGMIFGWLWQAAQNGLFVHARLKFNTAIAIVDDLMALG